MDMLDGARPARELLPVHFRLRSKSGPRRIINKAADARTLKLYVECPKLPSKFAAWLDVGSGRKMGRDLRPARRWKEGKHGLYGCDNSSCLLQACSQIFRGGPFGRIKKTWFIRKSFGSA